MISIAFFNMTAGCGQTTLAVNLAWHLYRQHGRRVLLVDLDPQFHASQWLMTVEKYDDHRNKFGTVTDVLMGTGRASDGRLSSKLMHPVEVAADKQSFLLVLPSEPELFGVLKQPAAAATRLRDVLATWQANFDFVLIDCGPGDSVFTQAALLAADCCIVPVWPARFSVLSYALTQQTIKEAAGAAGGMRTAYDLGVVLTRTAKRPTDIEDACITFVRGQAPYVFKAVIPEVKPTPLREVHGKDPSSDTRYARVLPEKNINELALEMDARIRALWPMIKRKH